MIEIIYQDNSFVVAIKPIGVLSEDKGANSMPALLREQLHCDIFTVHRLDQPVSGLMIYAKTVQAAGKLSGIINEDSFQKEYLAVCHNKCIPIEETLTDLLYHDKNKNKSYVVDKQRNGVKMAKLTYTPLEYKEGLSFIKVKLYTGRTHQIRVQMAHRGHPLAGDGKYGSKINRYSCALYSYHLSFTHPFNKKKMDFVSIPKYEPFTEFNLENL